MKQTTPEYNASMAAPIRDRSFVEIVFQDIDTQASQRIFWADNGAEPWSDMDTVAYNHQYGPQVATLEKNLCMMGGDFKFSKKGETDQDGFVSSFIIRQGQVGGEVPTVHCMLAQKSKFPGLTIVFDTRAQEHPHQLSVIAYDGHDVKRQQTFTVTHVTEKLDFPVVGVNRLEIKITSPVPGHRARIERIGFGYNRIFTNEDLMTLSKRSDIDPLSRRLPKQSLSFTISDRDRQYDFDNPSGIWKYVDENAPVSVRFGYQLPSGVYWLEKDSFIMNGAPKYSRGRATFSATGVLESLKDKYYKSDTSPKTLYSEAKNVLEDAFGRYPEGDEPWVLSESLFDTYTSGIMPVLRHSECLQLIAHAGGCRLFTDSDGKINIQKFSTDSLPDTGFELTNDSIKFEGQTATKSPALKSVEVKVYSPSVSEEFETLFDGYVENGKTTILFNSPAQNVSFFVDGIYKHKARVYANGTDFVNYGGQRHVKITGRVIKFASQSITEQVGLTGEKAVIDNPLITSTEFARALLNRVKSYLIYRGTYDMEYRGNPEIESGDRIKFQTAFSPLMDGLVLVDEIDFNGAIHGKMKVKELVRRDETRSAGL